MSKEGKTIYDLELGEILYTSVEADSDTKVERVPGGWNYVYYKSTTDLLGNATRIALSAVFVPWYNEFFTASVLSEERLETVKINAEGLEKRLKTSLLDLIARLKNKQK